MAPYLSRGRRLLRRFLPNGVRWPARPHEARNDTSATTSAPLTAGAGSLPPPPHDRTTSAQNLPVYADHTGQYTSLNAASTMLSSHATSASQRAAPGLGETLTNVAASGTRSRAARERLETLDGVTHARNRARDASSSSAGPSVHFVASQGVREAQVQSPTVTHASLLSAPVIPPPSAPAAIGPSSSQATASADVATRVNENHPLLSNMDAHSERVVELLQDMRDSLRRMSDRPPPSANDEDVQGSAGVTVQQLELSPGDNASPEPSGPQAPPNDEQQQPVATTNSTPADRGAPTGPESPFAAAGAISNNFIASDVPVWSPVKRVPSPPALGVPINLPGFDESFGLPSRLLLDPQVVGGTSRMQETSAARVDDEEVEAQPLDSSPIPGAAAARAEDGDPAASSIMTAQALSVPSEGRRSNVEAFRQHASSESAHNTLPLATQSSGNSGRRTREGDGHAALAQSLISPSWLVDEYDTTSGTGASASAALDATRCSLQPESTSGVDVGQANGGQKAAAPSQALSPASDTASLSDSESEAVDTQSQAALDEDPFDTLVSYRPTSELFPGTLRLVIDVGTDGEVHDGDKLLFLGDLDEALDRIPGICAERKIEWTHLYLRIRKPVYKGQDSVLKIMRCLRPYLRCFSGARFVMDEVLKIDTAEHFRDDFARLLFLSLEGKATKKHALLFPLNQLRYLNLSSQMEFGEMIEVIYRSQMLDFLKLGYQKDHGHRHIAHSDAVITLPHHITFPYAMDITTNDPNSFLPSLRAAELTTTDLRLKVTVDLASCSTEVKALFARNDGWMLS